MANPQYPMQPPQQMHQQMQPQMPPQMHQPGMTPRPKALRQGTSRTVPVVVSAGLAVGVFCGLLFGLGTGDTARAAPSKGNNVKPLDPSDTAPTPMPSPSAGGSPSANNDPAREPTVKSPTVAAPAVAGATTPATTGTKPAPAGRTNAEPAVSRAKITVELKPDSIASTSKVMVDGKQMTGGTLEIVLGDAKKKTVKLLVKASGYKDHEQIVEVEGDTTVKIELSKRGPAPSVGVGTGGTGGGGLKRPPPPGGKKKPPPAGGGLIDI